jgi:hypothetical protein
MCTKTFAQVDATRNGSLKATSSTSNPKIVADSIKKINPESINVDALFGVLSDSVNKGKPAEKAITSTTITLLLSFDASHAAWKMSSYMKAEDPIEARGIKMKESSQQAMDFYEGFMSALNESAPFFNIKLQVFDAPKSDSLLRELLKNDSLKNSDIIIGPGSISGARIVSEFCKKNKIINVQPFIAARNIAVQNPYMVKLAPSIDAHMGRIFKTIVDSFSAYKTVIYCSKRERDFVAATAIDTLFKEYNLTAKRKLNYVFVNNGDTTKSASARSLSANVSPGKTVIVYCSYDPTTVEQTLKSFQRGSAIIFGMPTWINEELIRVDYMNNADLHYTDEFYADTTNASVNEFTKRYADNYIHTPSPSSFLGYDVAQYLFFSLKLNGYNFAENGLNSPYTGLGYNFSIKKYFAKGKLDAAPVFQYFTNESVHQFRIQDYRLLLSE